MKYFVLLVCSVVFGLFNTYSVDARSDKYARLYGNMLRYSSHWRNTYLETVCHVYQSEKLTITLEPFFMTKGQKIEDKLPVRVVDGRDIWKRDNEVGSIDDELAPCVTIEYCKAPFAVGVIGEVEVPNTKEWVLEVAATLKFGRKDLIRDTLFIASSDKISRPLQYLDTTVLDFIPHDFLSDEICSRIRKTSAQNRVVVDLFTEQEDSIILSGLNQLPKEDALTYYLNALWLSDRYGCSMRAIYLNRKDYPSLKLSSDRVLYPNDSEYIQRIKDLEKRYTDLREDKSLFDELGFIDYAEVISRELRAVERELEVLTKGEPLVLLAEVSVEEAVEEYLKRCFALNESFVEIAKREPLIPWKILAKILGEDLPCDKIKHLGYVNPMLEKKVRQHRANKRILSIKDDIDYCASSIEPFLESNVKNSKQNSLVINDYLKHMRDEIRCYGYVLSPSQSKSLERYLQRKANYLIKMHQ